MRRLVSVLTPVLLLFLSGCGDQAPGPDPDLTPSFAKGGTPSKPDKPGGGGNEDPSGPLVFVSIETSYHPLSGAFTCGIATDGFAYCWGANDSGELGNGTSHASPMPVKVAGQ